MVPPFCFVGLLKLDGVGANAAAIGAILALDTAGAYCFGGSAGAFVLGAWWAQRNAADFDAAINVIGNKAGYVQF